MRPHHMLIIAVLTLLPLTFTFAQETGEMLRFDNQVNLSMEITEELMLKRVGDVLYQSGISSESGHSFDRILINGLLPDHNLVLQITCETERGEWGNWIDTESLRKDFFSSAWIFILLALGIMATHLYVATHGET